MDKKVEQLLTRASVTAESAVHSDNNTIGTAYSAPAQQVPVAATRWRDRQPTTVTSLCFPRTSDSPQFSFFALHITTP